MPSTRKAHSAPDLKRARDIEGADMLSVHKFLAGLKQPRKNKARNYIPSSLRGWCGSWRRWRRPEIYSVWMH